MNTDDLPDLSDEEAAFTHMRDIVDNWLILEQLNQTAPMVAASKLLQVLVDVLLVSMGRSAVRTALLMVHERTYDAATTFADRQAIQGLVNQLSNARRQVEGKPHIIVPGSEG